MADIHNPYAPPAAAVADITAPKGDAFQPVKIFGVKGRVGRMRYCAYMFAANVISQTISAIIGAAVGFGAVAGGVTRAEMSTFSLVIGVIVGLPTLIYYILVTIQRGHDLNMSGWTALLTLIPLVVLYWMFAPGKPDANRFGAPPPPNSTGVKVLFWIGIFFVAVAIISIVAAIVIPAMNR
ncbi:MAG: DUF805 domain-containing protein [Burkholderiaceae bacterium]|jgi:uncharacterized membrane protein YhaH (DUF805 family)|nr:DUF805 domain-containing protein [Burkholderiaceae bacterium]